jgi:hypothetical protein
MRCVTKLDFMNIFLRAKSEMIFFFFKKTRHIYAVFVSAFLQVLCHVTQFLQISLNKKHIIETETETD